MIKDIDHPRLGVIKGISSTINLSRTPTNAGGYAPMIGEHSRYILTDIVGVSEDYIQDLETRGILSSIDT